MRCTARRYFFSLLYKLGQVLKKNALFSFPLSIALGLEFAFILIFFSLLVKLFPQHQVFQQKRLSSYTFKKVLRRIFIWRATSSLAVGHFAAKRGSLRSPRGRLVASLLYSSCQAFLISSCNLILFSGENIA